MSGKKPFIKRKGLGKSYKPYRGYGRERVFAVAVVALSLLLVFVATLAIGRLARRIAFDPPARQAAASHYAERAWTA